MKIKNQEKFKKIIMHLSTIIVSFIICYYLLYKIFLPFNIMIFGRLSVIVFISIISYMLIKWLTNNDITNRDKIKLFFSYLILIIGLSLSREPFWCEIDNFNFKLFYFNDFSFIVFFVNILLYIPIGYFIRKYFKIKILVSFFSFILYIFIIEYLQYIFKVGFFDINDIILNTVSFSFGMILPKFIRIFFLRLNNSIKQ